MIVLDVRDVSFAYGTTPVIAGVSLEIRAGEAVALLGRNGAGKTTLTKLIVALLQPASGEIDVAGVSNHGLKPEDVAHRAAYVFQHADQQLFARTVMDEVMFGPLQLGLYEADARHAAEAAIARMSLSAQSASHPYDLPVPARKLVALASALAMDPALLILDEPTLGLDRAGKLLVVRAVQSVVNRGGAVMAVTHDGWFMAEALERALTLDAGKLAGDQPVPDVVAAREGAPAQVSELLDLPGRPVREAPVVAALARLISG